MINNDVTGGRLSNGVHDLNKIVGYVQRTENEYEYVTGFWIVWKNVYLI